MPRQARLDAPGTLHHVMGRGIEGSEIFRSKNDQMDFLGKCSPISAVGGGRPVIASFFSDAGLPSLADRVVEGEGITEEELRSGGRTRRISRARRLFCQLAVKRIGHHGAEFARFLGVTTSAVFRVASRAESLKVRKYLKYL